MCILLEDNKVIKITYIAPKNTFFTTILSNYSPIVNTILTGCIQYLNYLAVLRYYLY